MNIVYLIGNGFDLNLGMKTRYSNFIEHYKKLPTDDDTKIVKKLQDEIEKNIENWSDFEFELGKFLNEEVDSMDAIILYNHLLTHLTKYIKDEENEYVSDDTQKNIFYEYLSKPYTENMLLPTECRTIGGFMSNVGRNDWFVKIITFNYTRSIENLLGGSIDENTQIGTNRFNYKIILSEIEHIHGFANERVIFGVNDASQITNDKLHTENVTIRYVKPDCNKTYGLEHDEKCQKWISSANLICLFGLSFGDTDKKWWQAVGNALLSGQANAIIFEYRTNIPDENHGPDRQELKDAVKDYFLSKTNFSEDSKTKIKKNMYITFSKDMFKLDKLKKRIETNQESV
jgi:hypothetical protein